MTIHKLLFAAALCVPCEAEMLRGKVLDASGAPIPGAHLRAGAASADTGRQGDFFLELAHGTHSLTAAKDGFVSAHLTVDAGGPELKIVLEIEPVRGAVNVTEDSSYLTTATTTATKTLTPLRDLPQSIGVVSRQQMNDQLMMSVSDAVRYIPGITAIQGENNRDQLVIRGQSTSADFFLNGVRDDVQYYRDLYNLDRLEVLKGANALAFGRGGGGGVVNRATKDAGFTSLREIAIDGGSFGDRRFAADFDQPLSGKAAVRLNSVYENSDSFRRFVNLERYGFAPAFTMKIAERTQITLAYELFHDGRTADRGIPSYLGLPLETPRSTYFGNPGLSDVRLTGNFGSAVIEHQGRSLNFKNRTLIGDYDKFYQNFVPGAVTADKLSDSLSAYNNATHRRNLFNQTDLTTGRTTGRLRHTLLAGVELGRQLTDNFRNTGYFGNLSTTLLIPTVNPVTSAPILFRQSATDANNRLQANVAAVYLQDQVELGRYVQIVAGLRFDYFDLQYHDNRANANLRRIDRLVSPRAGLVLKPTTNVSLYVSYGVSYLPSSGDQFSSLTTLTQQVKPERFRNLETGAKWDLNRNLSLTAALFRLDRTNTRATDPNDVTRIVQTGSQRTNGAEVGWTGSATRKWSIAGGFGYQDAFVTSATAAARAGAQVAQTPHFTFSVWNRYQFLPRVGAGLGILNRSAMFAAIDNTVTLPGHTRADAAVFFSLTERIRLQANAENVLNRKYFQNADNNNNISPGAPRTVRLGITARF